MARGKKKEKLSLEEKLERALVPLEEQPYEVPGNWCWTTVESISDIVSKGTTPKGGKSSYVEDGIRFLRVENFLDDGTISHEGMMHIAEDIHFGFLKRSILKKDDVLISIAGTLGKTAIVQEDNLPINTNQAVAFIRLNSKAKILPKYLRFSLVNPMIQNYLLQKTKVTSIPNLTLEIISGCPIPLPPLSEQQRIVERVESLFAKLDEAKEKAQNVLDTFEDRKAIILYKAFQGELTEKWRKKRDINILDWKQKTIKDVCNDIKVGIVIKPTQYYTEPNNGVAAFRSANVREAYIEDRNWVYINQIGQQENKRSEVHTGDVLVVRSGNLGTACVVTEDYDGFNAIDIIIAVPDKLQMDSKYLCYYTNSPEAKRLVKENKRGMALPHFNVGGYSKLSIKVPSLEEQYEIVRIIEMEMSKEQKSKGMVQSVVEEIDVMKKAILAKAIRGELGTNNPDEESSVELLKQILEQEG